MHLEEHTLKGRHFPEKGRKCALGTMLYLYVFIASVFIGIDAYENFTRGKHDMLLTELAIIAVLFITYLLFPKYIKIKEMTNIALITLLFSSFYIMDYNVELILFWIAVLPIVVFYFTGVRAGVAWSVVISLVLFCIMMGSWLGLQTVFEDTTLLFQIFLGFVLFSYGLYRTEEEKSSSAHELTAALEEKEILFKEVHHRTKNNMQVIMGLLETQSFKIQEPQYKKMFQAHVDRIKAMSFVHETLYTNEHYEKIDMYVYLNKLADSLQKITPHIIITDIDFVFLDIRSSMNMGLIFNEAVTNSIEHAYTVGVGYIDVSLKRVTDMQCVLTIKDYGQGFNVDKEYQTLGMTLIEDLSVGLPNGSLDIKVDNGTQIKIYCDIKGE